MKTIIPTVLLPTGTACTAAAPLAEPLDVAEPLAAADPVVGAVTPRDSVGDPALCGSVVGIFDFVDV